MAKCVKLQRTKTKVCVGNLDKYVSIYARNIATPLNPLDDEPDYREVFTLIYQGWAMVQTPRGPNVFDDINIDNSLTVNFYIRYIDGITSQNWVIYDDNRYDILRVTDFEKNKLFLKLACVLKGSVDKEASKA